MVCRIASFSMILNDPKPDFKVRPLLDAANISEMAKDTVMEGEKETAVKLSNGTTLNDLLSDL